MTRFFGLLEFKEQIWFPMIMGGQQGPLENRLPGVLPGTRFEVDNILYRIAFVDGETGLVRCSVVELDNEDSVRLNLQVGDEVVFEAHVVQRGVENRY